MKISRNRLTPDEVFRHSLKGVSRATITRRYVALRHEQSPNPPLRCDIPECPFHTDPLTWNGKTLPLIVDHINGNRLDNRIKNLRLVCPNCDSQLVTRGGKNRGRVKNSSGGFAIKTPSGTWNYVLPIEPGKLCITGSDIRSVVKKHKQRRAR